MTMPKLPHPGPGRFWNIEHQPRKKTAPLRIELRERLSKDSESNLVSLSSLVGYGESIADTEAVHEEAEKVLIRAGQSDKFVGIWSGGA